MPLTDPLGDMLTRIRNGQQARKDSVVSPASKAPGPRSRRASARGLYPRLQRRSDGPAKGLRIELKYFRGQPAIPPRVPHFEAGPPRLFGKPGAPRVRNGLGITIVSTPRGVLSDAEARDQNVGGESLAEVF
jgi:small subunit ribosomal protein S8